MSRRNQYYELVLGNRDFRWLWFGQIVSLLGDWFNTIASVALIAMLTESGLAVGSLFVVRMLAPFLTSPLAGVVADRFSRRSILVATDLFRGCVVLGMLLVRQVEWLWLLYMLTALQLGASSFFFTARNAILPDIVAPPLLGTANAISSATWSAMLALGAALGGFTVGWLGVYPSFAIDAVTFFISGCLVAQIGDLRQRPDGSGATANVLEQYMEGLRFLRANGDAMVITLHKAALAMLLGTTFRVVQVSIASDVFPLGEQGGITTGLLFAVAGIGTALGPITVRHFIGDAPHGLRWAILGGYLVGGLGLAVTATLYNLTVMLTGSLLAGVGNGILWVFSTQLLLQMVPSAVRGRVFGTEFAMFTLSSAVGSAIVGSAVDSSLGISGVALGLAFCSLLPAIGWTMWLWGREARI